MAANQSVTYAIDLVMCIDGTSSMSSFIKEVKSSALDFYKQIEAKMKERSKKIHQLRAKVIVFRDHWADSPGIVMQSSKFFDLRSESSDFTNFISKIKAEGGSNGLRNGLEAVGLALKSDWEKGDFSKKGYVVVVYTDASAHSLEKGEKPSNYPENIPKTFDELTDYWHEMPVSAKRLVLFAPDVEPWTVMSSWENTVHYVSEAGNGLEKVDKDQILDVLGTGIWNSI